jgi:hypothetical protein
LKEGDFLASFPLLISPRIASPFSRPLSLAVYSNVNRCTTSALSDFASQTRLSFSSGALRRRSLSSHTSLSTNFTSFTTSPSIVPSFSWDQSERFIYPESEERFENV